MAFFKLILRIIFKMAENYDINEAKSNYKKILFYRKMFAKIQLRYQSIRDQRWLPLFPKRCVKDCEFS